jgi:hypothetical protein
VVVAVHILPQHPQRQVAPLQHSVLFQYGTPVLPCTPDYMIC